MHRPVDLTIAKLVGFVACVILMAGSCSAAKREGFAIYFTEGDIPPARMSALSQVNVANPPFIGMQDIISYNAQTHELKLTADTFDRIVRLEVPVQGKSFVVCVDQKPIYCGAFWTPLSSIGYDGVNIWKPLDSQTSQVVTLELGYPTSTFYRGEDPRNNPEVLDSIEKAGKLVNKLSMTGVDRLPGSMKGYELYSWFKDSQWYFTLITGTNRNKTFEEIVNNEDFISETGWVKIRVSGVDALENAFSKLFKGEDILWLATLPTELTSQGNADIKLPPSPVIDDIKDYAASLGLNLMVQTPVAFA